MANPHHPLSFNDPRALAAPIPGWNTYPATTPTMSGPGPFMNFNNQGSFQSAAFAYNSSIPPPEAQHMHNIPYSTHTWNPYQNNSYPPPPPPPPPLPPLPPPPPPPPSSQLPPNQLTSFPSIPQNSFPPPYKSAQQQIKPPTVTSTPLPSQPFPDTMETKTSNEQARSTGVDTDYEEGEVLSDADNGSRTASGTNQKVNGKAGHFSSTAIHAPNFNRRNSPIASIQNKKPFHSTWDSRRRLERDEYGTGLPLHPDKPVHALKVDNSRYKSTHNPTSAHGQNYSQPIRSSSTQKPVVDSISPKTKVFDTKRDIQNGHVNGSENIPQSKPREREHPSVVESRSPIRKSTLNNNRARAKVFIRVLHEHGYTFADLAKEDLDLSILKELYTELGFSAGPSKKVSPRLPLPPRPKSPQAPEKLSQPSKQPSISQLQTIQSGNGSQQSNKTTSDEGPHSKTASCNSQKDKPLAEPSPKTDSNNKAQASILNTDNTKAKEAKREEPTLERKDYIAMLLAAKKQKSSLAPSLPRKPVDTTSIANKVDSVDSREVQPAQIPKEMPMNESMDDVAEKKRTQTELAKQRIEALAASKNKGKISGEEKPRTPTSEPTKSLSKVSVQDSSKTSIKSSEVSSTIQHTEPSPESSKVSSAPVALTESQVKNPSSALCENSESQTEPGTSENMQSSQSTSLDKHDGCNSTSKNSIPGLFMTVQGTPSTRGEVKPILPISTPDSRSKKRPVAADFDDFSFQPPTKTLKRPFGNGYNGSLEDEEMIIHVSDDESSESESEGEIVTDKSQSRGLSDTLNSQSDSQAMRRKDMPPLSDFPRRTLSTKRMSCYSGSGRISPSGTQSPGSSIALEKTEEQISTIRRRIAELEQRKKHKLAAIQADNPSETTASLEKMVEMMVQENDVKPSSETIAEQSGQALSLPEPPIKDSTSVVAERAKSELRKSEDLRQTETPEKLGLEGQNSPNKYQRKDEIQKTLASSDAAVEVAKAQLDQLRKDVENAEMKLQNEILQKEKLAQEFQALSVISLPTPKPAISEHEKNDSMITDEPRQNDANSFEEKANSEPIIEATTKLDQEVLSSNEQPLNDSKPASLNEEKQDPNQDAMQISEDGVDTDDDQMQLSDSSIEKSSTRTSNEDKGIFSNGLNAFKSADGANNNEIKEKSLSTPVSSMISGLQELHSPDPRLQSGHSPNKNAFESCDKAEVLTTKPLKNLTIANNAEEEASVTSDVSSKLMLHGKHAKNLDDEDEVSLADSKSSDFIDVKEITSETNEHVPDTISANTFSANPPNSSISVADDLAPELRASKEPESVPVELKESHLSKQDEYRPYESPLKAFKSYRYHPEFEKTVKSGYRSMTYSHNIDSAKPICQYEAAGGTCNDEACDSQHFRQMGLSDDMILVRLGTSNPGRTKEEEQQWNEGLKLVLKNLRQKNTKDLDVVAKEIASYRRRFLKDPSKILNL